MKKFRVRLHWYLGGYETRVIWASDLEIATQKVKEQLPTGFALKSIKEEQ